MGQGKGPLGAEQLWEDGKGRLGQSGGKSVLGKTTLHIWIWIQENVNVKFINTNTYLLALTNNDK